MFVTVQWTVRTESSGPLTAEIAVQWLRRLDAGISPQSPGVDRKSVHVRFVVNEVAL